MTGPALPVTYRLYLPQTWAEDADHCAKAAMPGDLRFATRPQIALKQTHAAQADPQAWGPSRQAQRNH